MKFGEKLFQTKLLSRLSHKVCRLLSSPVLLRKCTKLADLATERERHLTTGKRSERTKLNFRYPICRSAIGQFSCLICARSRQQTFPFCCSLNLINRRRRQRERLKRYRFYEHSASRFFLHFFAVPREQRRETTNVQILS